MPRASKSDALLDTLKTRFEANPDRHPGISWADVRGKLEANPAKLRTLAKMERTGGEPDVVGFDPKAREYVYFDCVSQGESGGAEERLLRP